MLADIIYSQTFLFAGFSLAGEFFSLAFLFLLPKARSVLGGEDKSGCCLECRHSLSSFVTYLICAIVTIMIIAKMNLNWVLFVKKSSYLEPPCSPCQFQSHVVIHVHFIAILGDSMTFDWNYPMRYCYPKTFPRFQYCIGKLLLCTKFGNISSTIRDEIDKPLMTPFSIKT